MIKSSFLSLKNKIYGFFQEKCEPFVKNSCLLSNIDALIMVFISLTLIGSTFLESEKIGLLGLGVVGLTVVKMFVKKGAEARMTPWDGAIFVYFVICLLSTFNSELVSDSVHGFLKTVIYILYYFCAANYFQTNQNKIRYFFLLIGILCSIQSVIAIWQNLCGVEEISTWQDTNYVNPEDVISRAYGTLKPFNPNLLGGYLVAGISGIIATAMLAFSKKNYKTFATSTAMFFICAAAIFFTGSRGAYLGLGAVIFAFVLLFTKIINTDFKTAEKIKKYWRILVGAAAGFFAIVLISTPQIVKRLMSIFILRGDSSTSFRMNVYNSSWQMFLDHPILGIGVGNRTFREIYGYYMLTGYDALSTYSVPLEIAVESGIFALLAFGAFILMFLYRSLKFISKPLENALQSGLSEKIISCAAILTVAGVMVHGLFDTIFFRPQVQFLFWTIIAIGSSVFFNTAEDCKNSEEGVKNETL